MDCGWGGGLWYIRRMDYTTYLWTKAILLLLVVAAVNFFYALVTGKTIEQARRDRQSAQEPPKEH